MSTINRLQRLTGDHSSKQKTSSPRADEISKLRTRIESIMSRRQVTTVAQPPVPYGSRLILKDVIEGDEVENVHGKFFIAHGFHPGASNFGSRHIKEISDLDMKAAALLANIPELASFNYADALFLDTETTGLSGGTGTLAFLIGLGWFEDGTFLTRQIFARDFSEERASLSFLLEMAMDKAFIVTFNGKAFDVSLLSTRFVLNRLPDHLAGMPHLDLLHPSRRLLGHRLDNSRLMTIEKEILGIHRDGDIPGSEIPQRYFNWLRHRDARFMVDVFEHNRLDVISMALLILHLAEMLKLDYDVTTAKHFDLLAASRLFLDRGDSSSAIRILESLIRLEYSDVSFQASRALSLIYKRSGRWSDAVRIWESILMDDPGNYFAVEELAKWFEHKCRDFKKAIDVVSKALNLPYLKTMAEKEALHHRLERLKGRTAHIHIHKAIS